MKKFLVLYRSSVSAQEAMAGATPEQAKAGMEAWMGWAGKAGDGIVDLGQPTGGGKRVTAGGVTDDASQVSGYSILQADDEDGAVALLRDHPHFHMPGETAIEVFELLDVPGT